MANTNNHLELLVGIQADTAGSKESIQSELNALSKQLTGLDVKINVDKESKKVLDDLSKLDLSKLKTQVDDLNNSLKGIGKGVGSDLGKGLSKAGDEATKGAKVAESAWKKALKETSDAVGADLTGIIKKGYTSVDEIKKAFSTIDGNVKLDFDVSEGAKKLQNFKAQIEREGITQTIDFKMVGIQDGNATVNAWMPNMIKETDRSVQQVNNSLTQFETKLKKLNNEGKITEAQFNEINASVKEMQTGLNRTSAGDIDKQIAKANDALDESVKKNKQVNEELREQERLRDQLHKLEVNMVSLSKSRPKAGDTDEYRQISTEIERMRKSSALHAGEVKNVTKQYQMLNAQTKDVGREQMGIIKSFEVAMTKFPIWMAASTAFYGTVRTAKEFFDIIVDIDTKMTDLRKVMAEDTDFGSVFDRATESAEKFGQTISNTLDAYTQFAKQGYTGAELGMLSDAAIAAGNVGDIETGKAAEYMTASLIQWKKEAKDAMGVIDQWNALSNSYATTVESLAQGQARAGATARAMGLDFEETSSLIGLLTATTKQSGNEIG